MGRKPRRSQGSGIDEGMMSAGGLSRVRGKVRLKLSHDGGIVSDEMPRIGNWISRWGEAENTRQHREIDRRVRQNFATPLLGHELRERETQRRVRQSSRASVQVPIDFMKNKAGRGTRQ
ncbi:MAG TPA: hypothetical protein VGD21_08290 [Lysobacter sp.]